MKFKNNIHRLKYFFKNSPDTIFTIFYLNYLKPNNGVEKCKIKTNLAKHTTTQCFGWLTGLGKYYISTLILKTMINNCTLKKVLSDAWFSKKKLYK